MDGRDGYIKTDGSYLFKPQFDQAELFFHNGFARVEVGGKWGIVKNDGSFLVMPRFDSIGWIEAEDIFSGIEDDPIFCGGFAPVKLDGKYGFIKSDGSYLVNCIFEHVEPFENGFAKVFLEGKWYNVTTSGKIIPSNDEGIGPLVI